jgi:Flp pilus assembly protein TadD
VSVRSRIATNALPLAIALVTCAAFLPALRAGFVTWDDDYNFLSNPHYRGLGWSQLVWMVTTAWSGHWTPLTWLTLSLDWTLWGMRPFGYHLTSLLLHAANSVVFFAVAARLLARALPGGSGAGIRAGAMVAALLFAIHPLRVESVVWVTERRDVLSGLFYLLTVLTYLRAADAESVGRRRWLTVSVMAFVLAMMSKAIVMSLPLVLLVLDVYPLRRFPTRWSEVTTSRMRPLLLEKIPYVLVALAGALTAVSLATAFTTETEYPWWARPGVFGYDLVFYLWKTAVPHGLSPLYELPHRWDVLDPRFVVGLLLPVVVTIVLAVGRRHWPAALSAWSVYIVTLAPVSGLAVHTGPQIAADRYTYLACLGIALLAGGGSALVQRADRLAPALRRFVAASTVTALAGLAVLSWHQSEAWHDSLSLWERAVAVDPSCAHCQRGLGASRYAAGDAAGAVDPLRRAVALRPDVSQFHGDLGLVLLWLDRPSDAISHLELATRAFPLEPSLRASLGAALVRTGRVEDGEQQLQAVLLRRPDHIRALTAMGFSLAESGRGADAVGYFERAIAGAPQAPAAHYGLARLYLVLGDQPGADRELTWLRAFDPDLAERAQRR